MSAKIKLNATSGGGSVSLQAPTSTTGNANIELKLPVADGSGFLKSDGSGNLSNSLTTSGTDNFTIANGNLVIGTSGKGIDFSATADGSGTNTSELLDEYEEGNFTPVITGSTTNPTQSYAVQYGYYVKVGRIVTIAVDIEFASSGITYGGGYALLSALPFNKQNSTQHNGITMSVGYSPNWTGNGAPTGGYMNPNVNYSYLMPYNSNGLTFTMANEVSNGTRLIAGLTYMTND